MSFASLIKEISNGKNQLKGGQSQGYLEKTDKKIAIAKYKPSLGKGSEYAAKYKAEDDKAYYQSVEREEHRRVDLTNDSCPSEMCQPEEITTIGSVANIRELNNEELTQVYQNYSFVVPEPSEHLEPIHNEREQILRLIESNQVCIIKGPTGCGKSTQIPQFILDSYVKRRSHCSIIVSQPRRIAAISVAQRVCEERKWEVGKIVGYQVALDRKADADTRLLYCTTGVLLEKIINAKHLNDYTHIVLDEVHEREEDMDFVMLVVRRFLRHNSPNVKVVLMSATIDVSRFAKYFEVYLRNEKQPAPYYEIKPKSKFTVQLHYLEALATLGVDLPAISADEPGIAKEYYSLIPMMIRAFNTIDENEFKSKRCHDEKGAVLIFLPGLHQIETLYDLLSSEDKKHKDVYNLWICPLHSSITKDEQEKVRKYAPPKKRKIILSTNIAESSITIPDVKYVIDFCLTKHLVADTITGFTSLQMSWASHTNCDQRHGRAGRVQDGRVYRLVPRNFYMFKMDKDCKPEMQRCPLDIIVLKCKKLMESECPLRLISSALDPPDLDNYEKTILKLKEIGALLTTCRGEISFMDGDLTFIGQVMAALPLDIHITKLILLGHVFDVLEEAIIMGCAMSVRNVFSEPFQRRLDAYNNKLLWADSSESDSIAYLNAYMVWRQLTGVGKFGCAVRTEDAWSRRYMLQIKHLHEVAKQEADIKKRLDRFNISVVRHRGKPIWNAMEKPLILKLVLAGAFYPHYYFRQAQNSNAECEAVKMLSGNSPYSSVYMQNMPHPAPLYVDQVKECMRKYGVSDNVQLQHDFSSKLIVTFDAGKRTAEHEIGGKNFHMNIPGEIVMPVYRAIKVRQLNFPIEIKLFHPSLLKEEMSRLNMLRSSSSMYSMSGMSYKPQITLFQQHIELSVCHVENAGIFFGHITSNKHNVNRINMALNEPKALRKVTGDILKDFVYAAPYTEGNSRLFYRAKVTKIFQVALVKWVEVLFIDYGNTFKLAADELQELSNEDVHKEIESIPPCALECHFAQIGPSIWTNLEGEWSEEANRYVTNVLMQSDERNPHQTKDWIVEVYSYVKEVASVLLYLRDNWKPSDKAPLTLNEVLRNKGWAREREENYFSKLNHKKRMEIEEKGEYNASDCMAVEEDSSVRSLAKDHLSMPTTSGRSSMMLKGPFSPLEMKLSSMVQCSFQKDVRVEWNSVNSVLLDSDPADPHQRLLVAGSVSQSSDGRKLTLNHTTCLPNMHGLAPLICLIFAPTAELRCDASYSRYTGALCGLGMKDSGYPLFPENDIEVNFDVEITNEDLLHINKLRYWINERYCSDDAGDTPDGRIIQIQTSIRHMAISLLKPARQSVKVQYSSHTFMWGQIPVDKVFEPIPEASEISNTQFVYKLLSGVNINPDNDRRDIECLVEKVEALKKTLESGLKPRQIYCDLCDENFEYMDHLRMHLSSNYHMQLAQWLTSRAKALKITK